MAFLSKEQLQKIGLKEYGDNVLISDKASIYSPELITIGSNVRIDDFCILSGSINLGNYIHISAFSALYGKMGINIMDYSGLSPRCTIYSASDDFSGEFMVSPMVPNEYTNIKGGTVLINKYCQIGSGSILMPNINIAEGTAIGAMSFVIKSTLEWSIYCGIPAEKIKNRSKNIKKLSDLI